MAEEVSYWENLILPLFGSGEPNAMYYVAAASEKTDSKITI